VANNRKSAIRQELVDAQRQLLEVLDRIQPDSWTTVKANDGWSCRDLLTHLTTAESGFVSTLRRMAAGEGGVPADFDPNRWNAGQIRRRADSSPDQMRAELEKSHQDMLALLDGLDDAALNHRGHLSDGTDGSTEDNFMLVASHNREHTTQLRSALAAAKTP
jgi:uncharacterized protein (TIGR03083 family)